MLKMKKERGQVGVWHLYRAVVGVICLAFIWISNYVFSNYLMLSFIGLNTYIVTEYTNWWIDVKGVQNLAHSTSNHQFNDCHQIGLILQGLVMGYANFQ
jgi:hypothetical protein